MNKPTASVAHGCFFMVTVLIGRCSSRKKRIENPCAWHNEIESLRCEKLLKSAVAFFKKTQKKSEFFLLFFVFYWEYPLFLQPDLAEQVLKREKVQKIRNGAVAQSVEQRTENPCVGGSIPPHTTEGL
jgi:hypothetical protein